MMEFNHKPVLFTETIESLAIRPEGVYIDGTMGGGGHSEAILQRLTSGKLLSIDQDPDAIEAAGRRLSRYPNSLIARGNFCEMDKLAAEWGITSVDGILLDIGVSSYQLDTPERRSSPGHEDVQGGPYRRGSGEHTVSAGAGRYHLPVRRGQKRRQDRPRYL